MRDRTRGGRRGAAAVELAALLPFILFVFVVAADWARLLYYTIALEGSARSGALVLSDQTTWFQAGANANGATAYPSGFCQSGTPALTTAQQSVLQATARAEAPGVADAATVSAARGTDGNGNSVVTVTVSRPFSTVSNFPGVPSAQTLSRSVTMRVAPQGTR